MSNEKGSNLKRSRNAAFSEDGDHETKRFRRKKSKTSKARQEFVQSGKLKTSNNTASNPQNERQGRSGQSESAQTNYSLHALAKSTPKGKGKAQENARSLPKRWQKQKGPPGAKWSLSASEGGLFGDHDPLLAQGDRYMILAVRTQILVYSTSTSRLVRFLRVGEHDKITGYAVGSANKNHLFAATYSGVVWVWDWTTGQEIYQWKSSERLLYLSEQWQDPEHESSSTFLLIHETSEHMRRATVATFSDFSNNHLIEDVVLENESLAPRIKILDHGRILVLYANNKLFLGEAARKREKARAEYIWRETTVPNRITSIDARSYSLSASIDRKRLAVDIVIGGQGGSILIYDDLLFKLMSKEKGQKEDDIVSRRLHWHRNDVTSVKWSLDGNYVVSGGGETVLVIWQLDTGQKQFLPHLSAAIRHVAISISGSAYVVHLADNSVMVLSSSELQPITYIGGLVLRQHPSNERNARRIPAILHHTDSNTLALAVPADFPPRPSALASATLLQTYDIRTQQQSSRQALVRNNITAFNVDPSGNPVKEPDVTHLKISHDGKWLATIDEWTPPEDDLKPLYPVDDDLTRQGKEIFLKFWAKDESNQSWELVTKIENPHSTRTTPCISILDLQAKPHRSEFSTVSATGSINIWTPKTRHRNGLPVRSQSGSQLYTWTLTHTLQIPLAFSPETKSPPTSAALEYSPCGSVLAISSNKSSQLHFVDPQSGVLLRYTQPGSHPGKFSRLAFLHNHLMAVSKDLRVYNAVSGELLYALALDPSVPDVLLVANQQDGTFAVVCLLPASMSADKQGKRIPRSQIMVFDTKSATPRYTKIVDGSVEILQSLPGENGYLLINDEAELVYLRRVGSSVAKSKIDVPLFEEEARTRTGLEDVFGRGLNSRRAENDRAIAEYEEDKEAGQVATTTYKTQSSFSDIFSRYSPNLPVRELFEQVVRVFKGSSVE